MNFADLFVALQVEGVEFLAGRGVDGFFEVGVQAQPALVGFVGDAVFSVDCFGFFGGFVSVVEVFEGRDEFVGEAMFVVKGDGALDGGVGDGVAVGEVFGDDAGSRFIFL